MGGLSPAERAEENERRRRRYAKEWVRYDRGSDLVERWLFGTDHRRWACSRAVGDTLEVAIGTGLNLPLYPAGVRLTGLDLTPQMLARARSRATELALPVRLCEGDAQALPFGAETFDTVLSTYSLCSVPDERRAIDEMARVMRPAGRLILVDHVRSDVPPIRWIQRLIERLPTPGADAYTRRPLPLVVDADLTIEAGDRLRAGIIERLVARKAA